VLASEGFGLGVFLTQAVGSSAQIPHQLTMNVGSKVTAIKAN